jgi:tRNA (mo5U34)-methyltransferase
VSKLESAELRSQVDGVPWYHTIDLPHGISTPGEYDHRSVVKRLPLPSSLAGARCLDVGTHDGFWAYEMERRGASEVMAIDIEKAEELDWPEPRPPISDELRQFLVRRKKAFSVAHEALGSAVEHRYVSVYNLYPEEVGTFDFVFIGSLLHHLRDPIGALMSIRRVTTGKLLVVGVFGAATSLMFPRVPMTRVMHVPGAPFWEMPNRAGLAMQLRQAGWNLESMDSTHVQPYGKGKVKPHLTVRPLPTLPQRLVLHYGALHVAALATPAPDLTD